MIRQNYLKQDQASDAPTSGYDANIPPAEPTTQVPPANPQANAALIAKIEAAGNNSNTDVYGYEKAKTEAAGEEDPKAGEEAPASPKVEPTLEEITDPATGYGLKPPEEPKVEDPPVVAAAPPPADPNAPAPVELDLKDVDPAEATKLTDFVKAHGLTKEVGQALVNLRKSELTASKQAQEEAQKQMQIAIQREKASWHKELKSDPTFGGDKFAHNVARVERLMKDFMPGTKKELTARGSMLPPYVMRDLSAIADKFYGGDRFVNGDGVSAPPPKTEEKASPLDFYNH